MFGVRSAAVWRVQALLAAMLAALALVGAAASSAVRAPTRAEGLRFTRTYVRAYVHEDFATACAMASHAYLQSTTRAECAAQLRRAYNPRNKFWAALRRGYSVRRTTLRAEGSKLYGYPYW